VVDQQLAAPLEQLGELDRSCRALEAVRLFDLHPRQRATLGRDRFTLLGELAFCSQKLQTCLEVLRGTDDSVRE
jgi:hypothetical protein